MSCTGIAARSEKPSFLRTPTVAQRAESSRQAAAVLQHNAGVGLSVFSARPPRSVRFAATVAEAHLHGFFATFVPISRPSPIAAGVKMPSTTSLAEQDEVAAPAARS